MAKSLVRAEGGTPRGRHIPEHDDIGHRFILRRPFRRRRSLRRVCLAATAFAASLLCVLLIGGGVFFARLAQGPIPIDLRPQIMTALNEHVGRGYRFDLAATSIEATEHGPSLAIRGLSVVDGAARSVVTAPKAAISVDPVALLVGKVSPTRLEISDIDLRLLILSDGQIAVSAGTEQVAPLILSGALAGTPHDFQSGSAAAAPPEATGAIAGEGEGSDAALRALAALVSSLVDATSGPDSAIGSLERVGITGRLVLEDRTHNTRRVFGNAALSFDREADGSAMLTVAADGPAGRWSVMARTLRDAVSAKTLSVDVKNLSLDEIALVGGTRSLGFDFSTPVSASVAFRLGPNGILEGAQGRFSLGAGYFKLDDPDHEPLLIDALAGGFRLDLQGRGIDILPTELRAGDSVFNLTGRVGLPKVAGRPWTVDAQASGTFGTERPGEKPIKVAHAGLALHVLPAERKLVVDHVEVSGPEIAFDLTAEVHGEGQGFRLKSTSSVAHMPTAALARLWPSFIAAPVRAWFLANLRGGWVERGTATVDLTDADLATMRAQRAVPDDHVHVEFAVSDVGLVFMPGLPPIANVDGSGVVTGHTVNFEATRGDMEVSAGHRLTLQDGSFRVPDVDPKPTPAVISVHVTGSIESAADLLSREALKPFANVPIDGTAVKGQADAHLTVSTKIGDHVPPEETKVTATATVTGVSAEKLIGKEGLVDTTLSLTADQGGFRAKGEGRMFGAPAALELKKPAGGGPSEAVINIVLDEAARTRAGIAIGHGLSGPVGARIATSLTPGEKSKAAVELDFTKAAMEGLVPGFSKLAGRPARATLTVLQHDGGTSLDGIVFEGGGAQARGSAELDGGGGFLSAKLSQLKLSPGDELKLDATQGADGLKLVARGANVDARPFLKWLGAAGPGGAPESADQAKNVELDLHAGVVTGQNNQALTGADLKLTRRGGQVRRLQMSGRFDRQPFVVSTVGQNGATHFVVSSSDAGASLSFMDLYKRMQGGRLDANIVLNGERMEGVATIHDFKLREDPAIKKLAAEGLASQNRGGDKADMHIDTSSVPFTRLEATFVKVGSRVEVRDGAFVGPEVGATVDGTLDFARDQVNVSGTFVPVFGVNNLFSQVPLFGPILGGGANEGLFGLNYRITGSASSPVLSVNPLSAIAPGFLRKIFGAIDGPAPGPLREPGGKASDPANPREGVLE